MSIFVETHVTRLFKEAGFEVRNLWGDRGGIVQGDGLELVVAPDVEALLAEFSQEPGLRRRVIEDSHFSRRLELKLYGGSASADLEGIYINEEFLEFVKERASTVYYKAQKEVDAIFDAEDAPDRDWDGARQAYAGIVAEFAAETVDGERIFLRVLRVADQSYNAYESGDAEADAAEAADVVEGRVSHGSVEIQIYEIGPSLGDDAFEPFDPDAYDPRDYRAKAASRIIEATGLCWPRAESEAYTLELAADLAAEEGEIAASRALLEKAVALGLPLEDSVAEVVSSPSP